MRRINLIPPEYASGRKALIETGLYRQIGIGAAVLILLVVVHYGSAWFQLISLRFEAGRLNAKVASAAHLEEVAQASQASLNAQLENLGHRMTLFSKKRDELLALKSGSLKWSDVVAVFRKSVPEKVWLDTLKLSLEGSEVKGGAFGNEKVSAFIQQLNGSRYFKNATFQKTEAGELNARPVVHFQLAFDLVEG